MGMKFKNLKELCDKKINVHSFECINELNDLIKYANSNEKFSIRFDRDKNYNQLPFYVYSKYNFETEHDRNDYLKNIMEEAKKLGCSLLCSNGYLCDDIQICNFVIKIDDKHNFILEFCTEKVPLREIYKYKTTIIKGNVGDSLKDMEFIRKDFNMIDERNIEKIISWAFNLNIINKNIEATLYEEKVGMLKEEIACWQID